ncbi:hypothetical protein [Asaccharospora irregularis]|uniref:hypothetical protein n=1 Tax=Asaccharospora irregularis TaxID=29359 RepID=UPI0013564777|nr:hypothetical protein [Asaccharospora irregularis]
MKVNKVNNVNKPKNKMYRVFGDETMNTITKATNTYERIIYVVDLIWNMIFTKYFRS